MKITIEPTEKFFMAGDVMVRMWQGAADDGSACVALVALVRFAGQAEAISEGLVSIPPPTPDDQKRWAGEVMRRMLGDEDE